MPPLLKRVFLMLFFRFQIEVLSYCTLTETFAIGFQKWFEHEWNDFEFFVEEWLPSLTSNLYELKSARIAHLLFFLMTSRFSTFTLRGILVCSLKMLVPFNQRIFYFRLVRFSEAMQRYFPYFRLFHFLCFLGNIGKTLWLLLKTMESIFNLCINCLLRFHFGYCNNGALKNVNGAG